MKKITDRERALVSAAEHVHDILGLCHTRKGGSEDPLVRELGEQIGFGAMMDAASTEWAASLERLGMPPGGQFTCGPCESTVSDALQRLAEALAPYLEKEKHEPIEPVENGKTLGHAFTVVDSAIRDGLHFYAFLSGGGLRVLSLGKEHKSQEKGYGEGPTFEYAMLLLAEDYENGRRPYGEVYGKTRPDYLTGQSSPSTAIDACVRRGDPVAAKRGLGGITVTIGGYGETNTPEDVTKRVRDSHQAEEWEARGFRYRTRLIRFPNGEPGTSSAVVHSPPGKMDPWMYRIERTATAPTLRQALDDALAAPEVEVGRERSDQ